jgi:hypothetical protein
MKGSAFKPFPRQTIRRLAKKNGLPHGWYSGPYFDDDGKLKTGMPPCLEVFALVCFMRGAAWALEAIDNWKKPDAPGGT